VVAGAAARAAALWLRDSGRRDVQPIREVTAKMLARIALLMLMSVGLAGFGAVAWISLHPAGPTPQASEVSPLVNDKLPVLVAARPLRAGSLLKPEDLAAQEMPAGKVPAGAWRDTQAVRTELLGAMIRRNLLAGEVVLPADALHPGDRGFLAAVLGSGMRAVTVGVDAVTGIAGLIWPGDRVDLILTQTQSDAAVAPDRRVSAETVLHNVRVIAIDRQLMQGATSESPELQAARTVTLEVTASDAERVAVAVQLGHLSLTVLAADHAPEAATSETQPGGITWGGDVSSALRRGPTSEGATVRLYQGPADSKELRF
jgi:pilus assembly protein CpaB